MREGTLKGCLNYITFGDGPPLVVFSGLGPSNANPTGLLRWCRALSAALRSYGTPSPLQAPNSVGKRPKGLKRTAGV